MEIPSADRELIFSSIHKLTCIKNKPQFRSKPQQALFSIPSLLKASKKTKILSTV